MPCFPDVFGLPDTKPPSFAFDNFYARQLVGGYRVGEIRIGLEQVRLPTRAWAIDVSGHFWPGAVIPDDVLTMDGVGARVLGKTYDASWSDGPPPCVHGVPCPAPPPGHTVLRVDASILSVHEMAVLVRRSPQGPLELRSAITVDLASVHGSAHFLPRAGAPPIPYVVDAVTGENLSTWEIWVCSERGCSGPV